MAGLLLLGLLACASMSSAQPPSLIVSEKCYHPLELDDLDQELDNMTIKMLPMQELCATQNQLLSDLSAPSSEEPLVASLQPALCTPAHLLARLHNRTLVTWNCPQDIYETVDDHFRVSPTIKDIATAIAELVMNMRWRPVALISSEIGWWPNLAHSVDIQLRRSGLISRHYFMIPQSISRDKLKNKFLALQKIPCRVAIIFSPANTVGRRILEVLDELELSKVHDTLAILVDVSTLPSWLSSFHPPSPTSPFFADQGINDTLSSNTTTTSRENQTKEMNFADKISFVTRSYVLVFTETNDLSLTFNYSLSGAVLTNIKRAIDVLEDVAVVRKREHFVLLDLKDDFTWRPLLGVCDTNGSEFRVTRIYSNLEEWVLKHKHIDYCETCTDENEFDKTVNVLIILASSCLFVAFLLGVVAVARNQLLKKRVTKGPYKVVLAATDFVFPQLTDSRRVDEGIEAMLCCWLQQLQEFGGPEVDKPDLLQGSGGSLRTPLKGGSSPSLAKTLIVDPRVRYNGDLVQMKPLPAGGPGVELRTKAVELLVVLHGLRHENLNPLIGCLADPPRTALVHEWCARGSLQDVLQQDEIKLDWSFRLSLLTDLVRGMRYLHSTPIRIHGYLSSRNCVIDARWVLKVTDYGLPAFYDLQGIPPPVKTARELLWTAPELLRHSGLRKKGTQSGDVYSFGIILQEVVVRGEPFCMLANTPEEIIDKLKRPPPLIRPSVSKGAAPPEAINIMRQCWAELPDMRPDFNTVHDLFKKLNHGRKVNFVDTMFQMLEKYSNNLEELIRERTEQLDIEKKKTEQLLNRMLPSSVAEKLKLGMPVDPEEFEEVTIYFSDIVGFTTISAHSTPFQVVDLLNDLYTCFDATINAYSVYKVETIGDAYMVVGGLPVRIPDHAEQVATMALDLLHQSGKFRVRHLPGTSLRLRIGLHTGPCCTGVVGLTMPRYCLFGDTVNTASRMESTGAAWRIHMSQATKDHLEKAGGYQIEYRGLTDIKGKGRMHTYWLLGKSGFDKTLPVPPPLDESHGLEESLIICHAPDVNVNGDDGSSGGSSEGTTNRSYIQADVALEQPLKSPMIDPTFIKTMECSKFSSLVKCFDEPLKTVPEVQQQQQQQTSMVKSTSSDTTTSLGMPVSASEVAAALLGASTSSLCGFKGRHRKLFEEEDLSTPYNHYRCLSPTEKPGRSMLRRQFSLDRTEDIKPQSPVTPCKTLKLCKQNSAGAADLERIEETLTPTNPTVSPCHLTQSTTHCSLSISVDSLTMR